MIAVNTLASLEMLAVIMIAALPVPSPADTNPAPGSSGQVVITNDAPRPVLSAFYTRTAPLITANPDDPAWKGVPTVALTDQSLGSPSGFSASPTGVQVLWDRNSLYVRFRCQGSEVYTPCHGHDSDLFKGDVVELFLDPKGDGRQVMELEVNANNDTLDKLILYTGDPIYNPDLTLPGRCVGRDLWEFLDWTWKGLRTASARSPAEKSPSEWLVDIAIPASGTLKRLGFKEFQPMNLRINFLRYDWNSRGKDGERKLVASNWSPVRYGCPHFSPAALGNLELRAP